MTKEERLLRQEQRERAKAIEAAAREAGRGPLDLPYLLLVLTLVGVGLIMLFSASFPSMRNRAATSGRRRPCGRRR